MKQETHGQKLLVVDDEKTIRLTLTTWFESAGASSHIPLKRRKKRSAFLARGRKLRSRPQRLPRWPRSTGWSSLQQIQREFLRLFLVYPDDSVRYGGRRSWPR